MTMTHLQEPANMKRLPTFTMDERGVYEDGVLISKSIEQERRNKSKSVEMDALYIPKGRQPTSQQAAFEFQPRVRPLREQVLKIIQSVGDTGYTDAELIRVFSKSSPNSIRPRRIDLVRQGKVKNSGRVRDRSIVWIAV